MHKRKVAFLLILLSLLVILYQHTLKYDLIWDTANFVKSSQLLTGDSSLLDVFTHGYIQGQFGFNRSSFYYRPIVHLTFGLEKRIWGLHSTGLRLTNIFIFALCLIILFIFFERLKVSDDLPYIITTLFAFLPLNVDNIVWVVSRCDLLLLLWGSLALLFLQSYIQKGKKHHLIFSSLFVLLGIFSKETFLFFFPLLLLFEYLYSKKITITYHLANGALIAAFFVVKNILLQLGSLQFMFSPQIFENLDIAFSVLGYYLRVILFPVNFPSVNFVRNVMRIEFLLLGAACLLIILIVLVRRKKEKQVSLSLALVISFLIPFTLLAFSDLWPFRISSRYMMLSALGMIWFFSLLIDRLKRKLKAIVVLLLVVLFIPSILSFSHVYRNEKQFWQSAHAAHPRQATILYMLALTHYRQDDELSAYYYLKKALTHPVQPFTARSISILLANLEYYRAEYDEVIALADRLPSALPPMQRYQLDVLKAKIYASRGDSDGAERILYQLISQFKGKKEGYNKLFQLYIGYNFWQKAASLEQQYKIHFHETFAMSSQQIRERFASLQPRQKVVFYASYLNYRSAIELLTGLPSPTKTDTFKLIEMYYKNGEAKMAETVVVQLVNEHAGDDVVLKSIGLFYLHRLKRVNLSLRYLQQALQINPGQAELEKMVKYLQSITEDVQINN